MERIHEKKRFLDAKRPLPSYAVQSIKDSMTIVWTYNSNGIEGNTLTLRETKMVIEEGFTIKGKSLREHFEVVNHQEAIEYVDNLANSTYVLRERDILEVHALVLQRLKKNLLAVFVLLVFAYQVPICSSQRFKN